jgi:hypothetical protein
LPLTDLDRAGAPNIGTRRATALSRNAREPGLSRKPIDQRTLGHPLHARAVAVSPTHANCDDAFQGVARRLA